MSEENVTTDQTPIDAKLASLDTRLATIEKDIDVIKNALAGFFETQNQIQGVIGFAMDTLATHGLITNVTPDEEKASWTIGDGKTLLDQLKTT